MKTIHEKFFKMEVEENFFDLKFKNGTYCWDIIRRDVFIAINSKSKNNIYKKDFSSLRFFKNLVKKIINFLTYNYIIYIKPKYVFTTFQRSIKNENILYDNVIEDVSNSLNNDGLFIENINKKSINYINLLFKKKTNLPPFQLLDYNYDNDVERISKELEIKIKKHFGLKINIKDKIFYSIIYFKQSKFFYDRIFKKHKPDFIIGSDNGSMKGLYSASKNSKIFTIELQHGSSQGSILWTYPNIKSKCLDRLLIPDAFLTFSKYWSESIKYPVKYNIPIGNNNFYQKKILGKKNIAFISNLMTHKHLIQIASKLSLLVNKKIFFKLHPQQYYKKEQIKLSISKFNNIKVISDEYENDDIFNMCNHIIGVRSTFLYRALQAGKNVYILKTLNYNWDKDVLKNSFKFKTSDKLNQLILDNEVINTNNKIPIFFERYNELKFFKFIKKIKKKLNVEK